MSLADMPVVTVEQIVRFREAAIAVERKRDELILASENILQVLDGVNLEGLILGSRLALLEIRKNTLRAAIAEVEESK